MFIPELPESLVLTPARPGLSPASNVQAMTSPVHLQAAAWLYGLQTSSPEKARVLELGCGTGSNLLPFALAWPESSAIGIDLFPEAIEQGQRQIQALGLNNVELFCADLETLLASEPGEFDYIVIHGVFALLDIATRQVLLAFCKQHLSREGVVCLSWHTLPGAAVSKTLQDAIALHSSQAEDEQTRTASAKAMMTYLSLGMSERSPQYTAVKAAINGAEGQDDTLFTLQYVQGLNDPCYLVDFNEMANQAGFAVAGDAAPHTECAEHFGDNVSRLHGAICPTANKILAQQYLDFAVNRGQRITLLVPADRREHILPCPDLDRLQAFSWAGSYRRVRSEDGLISNVLQAASGKTLATDDVLTLTLLDIIGEAWPLSVSFDQLVFHSSLPENDDGDRSADVLKALQALFLLGTPDLHYCLGEGRYNQARNGEPAGFAGEMTSALGEGFNLWHEPVTLTRHEFEILQQGDIHRQELETVESLRRKGLVLAAPDYWKTHYQRLAGSGEVKHFLDALMPLILHSSDPKSGGFNVSGRTSQKTSVATSGVMPVRAIENINRCLQKGEYDRARMQARALCEQHPDNPNAWLELAVVQSRTGNYHEALTASARTLKLASASWAMYFEIAMILVHLDYHWHAGRLLRANLRSDRKNALVWDALGRMYRDHNDLDRAERCARKAVEFMSGNAGIYSGLGTILGEQSRMEEAFVWLRKALVASHYDPVYHTNLLFGLSHSVEITPEALFKEHRDYGIRVEKWAAAQKLQLLHSDDRDPDRRLRIGFVSGDLCRHPVANFVRPFWNMLANGSFERYVYSTSSIYDEVSEEFKRSATQWRSVLQFSHTELAKIINDDGIDILIDLSGHTGYNRLPVFALRPAPLSISWIGYPGTTGLKQMDYRLTSTDIASPGELDSQFSEKLLYMPMPVQFEPEKTSPPLNSLPALKHGSFTFGSLNRPKKLNDQVLKLWARILVASPSSRMIVGYMADESMCKRLRDRLENWGVKPRQLEFRLKTNLSDYLSLHHEIDILLDTFPYTGGTTTNHAMWMGVPTISIQGKTMAARQGIEIMRAYDLEAFLVNDEESYYREALLWTKNLDRLNEIRLSMRERFAARQRQDNVASAGFVTALRTIWKHYCTGQAPESFVIED